MFGTKLSDISPHLTRKVINRAFKLKTSSNDNVKSIKINKISSAENGGMLSVMYRIKVKGRIHKTVFIAKTLLKNKLHRRSVNNEVLFRREALFYTKIFPTLMYIQKSREGRERLQSNIPFCYACYHDGANDFMLLEDLTEKFHFPIGEASPLQIHHVIDTLAHFHSASIVMKNKAARLFYKLVEDIDEIQFTDDNRAMYEPFLNKCFSIIEGSLLKHEEKDGKYFTKFLETVEGDVYEYLVDMATTKNAMSCIAHGDCWFSNFMASETSVALIDFQLLRYTSPAVDLMIFILITTDLTTVKFEEAVNTYYVALQYYMSDMKCHSLMSSVNDLWSEIKKYGKFAFLQAMMILVVTCNSKRSDFKKCSFSKYKRHAKIPLEALWDLKPLKNIGHQLMFVRALQVAVDLEIL